MKSLKINSLLALGFVTGLFVAGSVNSAAQGLQQPSIRDCARQMCMMMRNCNGEGQIPDQAKKQANTKKTTVEKQNGADTQGTPNYSCRGFAFQEYWYCSGIGAVKPQDNNKPADTKK